MEPRDLERSPVRQILGGTLRADDPRRFLVEVMVGAIHADGHVDRREQEALRAIVTEHDLFAGLPERVADAMLDLAADALWFAGGLEARLGRVAAALPWRLHRLAAYAMACEVIAADDVITPDEEAYLGAIRRALTIGEASSGELVAAARQHRAMSTLDGLAARVRELRPRAAEIHVAERVTSGQPLDAALAASTLGSMLDFGGAPALPPRSIEEMATSLPPSIDEVCTRLAGQVRDRAERYWSLVYALALSAAGGPARWRDSGLLRTLRLAFGLSVPEMDRCAGHGARVAELCAR